MEEKVRRPVPSSPGAANWWGFNSPTGGETLEEENELTKRRRGVVTWRGALTAGQTGTQFSQNCSRPLLWKCKTSAGFSSFCSLEMFIVYVIHPVTWRGASLASIQRSQKFWHLHLKREKRRRTRKEKKQIHATNQCENYSQSWLGQTFRVWIVFQFFCHMNFWPVKISVKHEGKKASRCRVKQTNMQPL